MVGFVLGVTPLTVAVVSPLFGYFVSDPIALLFACRFVLFYIAARIRSEISVSLRIDISWRTIHFDGVRPHTNSCVYQFLLDWFQRFLHQLSSTLEFLVLSLALRIVEGVGSAAFYTASFTVATVLFPSSTGTIMVRER